MLQNDRDWLGTDDLSLAPRIRAGLGILLAAGNWTWWHHPGATSTIMLNAVRSTGIATWGGDEAVLNAHEWLDQRTAIEIAEAFDSMVARRGGDLRLKIQRRVFSWVRFADIEEILSDLALAFDRQRTFLEWPTDRRPRTTSVRVESRNGLVVTGAAALRSDADYFVRALPESQWIESATDAHFAFGTIEHLQRSGVRAEVTFLLEDSRRHALAQLDSLRSQTRAQCAVLLPMSKTMLPLWLEKCAQGLAGGHTLLEALSLANSYSEIKAEIIASTQTFMLRSKYILQRRAPGLPLGISSAPIQPSSDYTLPIASRRAARTGKAINDNLEIEAVRMASNVPATRILRCTTYQNGIEISHFPQSGSVSFEVIITPFTPLLRRDVFPETNLIWKHGDAELQVHMVGIGISPISKTIFLPPSGPSTSASFDYIIHVNSLIDLRLIVSAGTRIIQTARIQGNVGSQISFYIESVNSTVEEAHQPFDLALLVNDSLGNSPSATVLSPDGIELKSLDTLGISETRSRMVELLDSVATNPDASLDYALAELAVHGKLLFDALKENTAGWPESILRIQLTTPHNNYFPLEFLYNGEVPESGVFDVCIERAKCLQYGKPIEGCSIRAGGEVLCPMGFLGVSSIIERKTWNNRMDYSTLLSRSKNAEQRGNIKDLSRIAFAASNNADNFSAHELQAGFTHVTLTQISETLGCREHTWNHWKRRIEATRPNLLVLIPHIEETLIYINDDESLSLAGIKSKHVGEGNPIVLAIGCNSGAGISTTIQLPSVLIRHGAKIVIGALTGVLGRYANIATLDLAQQLIASAGGSLPISLGEIINKLRRDFLAKNNPLGLVLIAYGDADYILGDMAHDEFQS